MEDRGGQHSPIFAKSPNGSSRSTTMYEQTSSARITIAVSFLFCYVAEEENYWSDEGLPETLRPWTRAGFLQDRPQIWFIESTTGSADTRQQRRKWDSVWDTLKENWHTISTYFLNIRLHSLLLVHYECTSSRTAHFFLLKTIAIKVIKLFYS